MVKKFSISCAFDGGSQSPVEFFVGDPSYGKHPIEFQSKWLTEVKGGHVPQDVMDSIQKIKELSEKNNILFEDLCFYAITMANTKSLEENPEFEKVLEQMV